jgi:hypothetical protein
LAQRELAIPSNSERQQVDKNGFLSDKLKDERAFLTSINVAGVLLMHQHA